jgi:hypothetical protein
MVVVSIEDAASRVSRASTLRSELRASSLLADVISFPFAPFLLSSCCVSIRELLLPTMFCRCVVQRRAYRTSRGCNRSLVIRSRGGVGGKKTP